MDTDNYPGYHSRYIRRLVADLYNNLGTIEYELNMPGHGQDWYRRSDQHRAQLWEEDVAEKFDLEATATVDGNLALAQLAEGGSTSTCIAVFTDLATIFRESGNRAVSAANLSIAHRLHGDAEESLKWCNTAYEWTAEDLGKDTLAMALCVWHATSKTAHANIAAGYSSTKAARTQC